ncbi:MAG: hypothetical protein WBE56_12830 [Terracidiphilus sp.]
MKCIGSALLVLSIAAAGSTFGAAQDMQGPPKVLQITREFIKPGKNGDIHDKSESKFVAAMAAAKWPTHYFALNSMSGKSRALYFTGYDSFAAWEKDNKAIEKDKALAAELDRDSVADGELLDGLDQFVFTYDESMSLRPTKSIAGVRYFEIFMVHVKPGQMGKFHEMTQLIMDTHKKAGTSAHWDAFEIAYGGDNEFAFFSLDKSMAEIDTGFAEDKQFRDALGDEGMRKLRELEADCIQDSDSELFSINPAQSYPPPEWVKADPDFWKSSAPAAKPAAAKKPAP